MSSEALEIEIEATENAETVEAPVKNFVVPEEITPVVEALIFAHGEPIEVGRIAEILAVEKDAVNASIEIIKNRFMNAETGIELVTIGGKLQFRTKGAYADILRELKQEKPRRLSIAALETLAIVAYRQPIVKSDIERIRGVDASPTIKTLLERGIIKIVGHLQTVGQPALYGTTDDFLKLFGLSSLGELPTLRDLTEIDSDPGEIGEESPEDLSPSVEEEISESLSN